MNEWKKLNYLLDFDIYAYLLVVNLFAIIAWHCSSLIYNKDYMLAYDTY